MLATSTTMDNTNKMVDSKRVICRTSRQSQLPAIPDLQDQAPFESRPLRKLRPRSAMNWERQVVWTLIWPVLTFIERATDPFSNQESANAYAEGADWTKFSQSQR
jgi:hypothetical protein